MSEADEGYGRADVLPHQESEAKAALSPLSKALGKRAARRQRKKQPASGINPLMAPFVDPVHARRGKKATAFPLVGEKRFLPTEKEEALSLRGMRRAVLPDQAEHRRPAPKAEETALSPVAEVPRRLSRREKDNQVPLYAAIDLGTNNCRLLIAEPQERGFRVVDSFSRIIRLGEGLAHTGKLSEAAMDRAIHALFICGRKMQALGVERMRLVATEACRRAENGALFLERVRRETGLTLEILDRGTEARLAVAGCATLIDPVADGVMLFDIGGGSSELVWLDLRDSGPIRGFGLTRFIKAWTSLPVGVVTLSERHGGMSVSAEVFGMMVREVEEQLEDFAATVALSALAAHGKVHMLGTSGTVTTLAGLYLDLPRYDRRRVDGVWLGGDAVEAMVGRVLSMSFDERVAHPCIGQERADLVLAGCAILTAIRRRWPCERLRVADRGLREGILVELMTHDGVWRRRPLPPTPSFENRARTENPSDE